MSVLAPASIAVAAIVALAAVALTVSRPLHLFVSNQSFEDPYANLTVLVDGAVVVSQNFFVASEHNWTRFDLLVGAGRVEVREADTGASATHDLLRIGERWLVVDFWGARPDAPAITLEEMSHEPAFM